LEGAPRGKRGSQRVETSSWGLRNLLMTMCVETHQAVPCSWRPTGASPSHLFFLLPPPHIYKTHPAKGALRDREGPGGPRRPRIQRRSQRANVD